MKVLVGTFNQEKALVGAFSVIVQLHRLNVNGSAAQAALQTPGMREQRTEINMRVADTTIYT